MSENPLTPLWTGQTFQVSDDSKSLPHSFIPSKSVDVPHATEIEVWRTGEVIKLVERIELLESEVAVAEAGKAFYELTVIQRDSAWREVEALKAALAHAEARIIELIADRDRLKMIVSAITQDGGPLDFEVARDDYEPPEPEAPLKPSCPLCGETERLNVDMVDVATSWEPDRAQYIPGTITCLNPLCPSTFHRYVHQVPDRGVELAPCCGLSADPLPGRRLRLGAARFTNNPDAVTCPGPRPR